MTIMIEHFLGPSLLGHPQRTRMMLIQIPQRTPYTVCALERRIERRSLVRRKMKILCWGRDRRDARRALEVYPSAYPGRESWS